MRIFAVLPGFFAVKKKRIFDQISVFWRSNFCIFQIFYFLTSRWFSQQLKLLCSVGFWCVFLQFCQAFFAVKKNVFLIRFLYFEGQIFAYFRFYFLTSRWFSQQLKLLCSVRFWCVILQFCQVFLLWKKNVFLIRFLYFEGQIFAYFRFYFLTSRWFSQQLKLLCSVGFWCVFLQFCQVFCCEKKTYFRSDFCISKVKFLHISDLLFSYKQMVFPAIKAPLLRRILMRIFAVLPGFFAVKKNVFLIRFLYFEGQIFAYIRSFIFLQADGFPSN